LAFSGLLFLAHDDGFRFNTFLLGLSMVACSVGLKTTFDVNIKLSDKKIINKTFVCFFFLLKIDSCQ
jgi:hypothetical protein